MKTLFRNKRILGMVSILIALVIGTTYFGQDQAFASVQTSGSVSISPGQGQQQATGTDPVYTAPVLTSKGGSIYEATYAGGKITIGDSSSGSYQPSLSISKWNGEASFGLTPQFTNGAANPIADLITNSVSSGSANADIVYKTTPLNANFNEYGGLDMIITLKTAPTAPLGFTFSTSTITPYLQPALVAQYKDGYSTEFNTSIKVTDTQVTDATTGKVLVTRPDYAVNSIALYANGKANHAVGGTNYKTGKIGQIFRMKATDSSANPKSAWLDWSLSGNNPVLSDTTGFLNTATYPVTIAPVGDTFGYTSVGASSYVDYSNQLLAGGDTFPGASGTGVSISIYGGVGSPQDYLEMGVFNGSYLVTNATTPSMLISSWSSGWFTSNFSTPPTFTAIPYLLAFNNCLGDFYYQWDSTATSAKYVAQTYDTWPSFVNWNTTGDGRKISIYATYTPATGISNAPSSINFGPIYPGSTGSTGLNYFNVTNNSASAVNISISGTDITGGTTWSLSDTAIPGTAIFGLKAGLNGGSYNINVKKNGPFNILISNLGASASQLWGLQLLSPTNHTDSTQKSGTVTLTATVP